jgi:Flp pilus assembly protein TadB
MGKKKSERKARRDAQREAEAEAKRQAEALATRRRRLLAVVVVLTVAAAVGSWVALEDERLAGISILVGGLLFLLVALGALGASVKPRDRHKAGAIDFGTSDKR